MKMVAVSTTEVSPSRSGWFESSLRAPTRLCQGYKISRRAFTSPLLQPRAVRGPAGEVGILPQGPLVRVTTWRCPVCAGTGRQGGTRPTSSYCGWTDRCVSGPYTPSPSLPRLCAASPFPLHRRFPVQHRLLSRLFLRLWTVEGASWGSLCPPYSTYPLGLGASRGQVWKLGMPDVRGQQWELRGYQGEEKEGASEEE